MDLSTGRSWHGRDSRWESWSDGSEDWQRGSASSPIPLRRGSRFPSLRRADIEDFDYDRLNDGDPFGDITRLKDLVPKSDRRRTKIMLFAPDNTPAATLIKEKAAHRSDAGDSQDANQHDHSEQAQMQLRYKHHETKLSELNAEHMSKERLCSCCDPGTRRDQIYSRSTATLDVVKNRTEFGVSDSGSNVEGEKEVLGNVNKQNTDAASMYCTLCGGLTIYEETQLPSVHGSNLFFKNNAAAGNRGYSRRKDKGFSFEAAETHGSSGSGEILQDDMRNQSSYSHHRYMSRDTTGLSQRSGTTSDVIRVRIMYNGERISTAQDKYGPHHSRSQKGPFKYKKRSQRHPAINTGSRALKMSKRISQNANTNHTRPGMNKSQFEPNHLNHVQNQVNYEEAYQMGAAVEEGTEAALPDSIKAPRKLRGDTNQGDHKSKSRHSKGALKAAGNRDGLLMSSIDLSNAGREAYLRALSVAEAGRVPSESWMYSTRLTRPYTFSYFSPRLSTCPECNGTIKPTQTAQDRMGKGKGSEMKSIFGSTHIHDYYPGGKKYYMIASGNTRQDR